jgi:hypothetical protein
MGKDIELAILFADVVGSTRLYELMGDLRARDMVTICIDCMRSATDQHQGTVIKTMGDVRRHRAHRESHDEPGQGRADHHHGGHS